MNKKLLIGLLIGAGVGTAMGLMLRPRGRVYAEFEAPVRESLSRFAAFKNQIRIRFEDTAESIKPAI